MEIEIIELNDEQTREIELRLDEYDKKRITYKLSGGASIGVTQDGELIAGADGCMTAFKIFYVSTLYVDESYRGKGIGKKLMKRLEEMAASFGANMIRLDTFDWQGAEFYRKIGYEQVGQYENKEDGFAEYFFLKKL